MKTKEGAQPVDLAQFDEAVKKQEDGILIPILGMDGKTQLGFGIRVAGPDSERARAASDTLNDELIDSETAGELRAAERAARALRYLAKITMAFEPSVVLDGQELAYTEDNAVKLYSRFAFIRAQVDAKAGRRAAFLKG